MTSDSLSEDRHASASARAATTAERWHVLRLALAVVIANAMLLVADGVYWDGLLFYRIHRDHDYALLRTMFSEMGGPFFYYVHRALGAFPGITPGYRLFSFLGLAGIAIFTDRILARRTDLTRAERSLVALAAGMFPAFQASIEFVIAPYVALYALFLAGLYLAIVAWDTRGPNRYVIRGCSLVLLTASFTLKSLLIFYVGFLTAMVVSASPGWAPRDLVQTAVSFARRNLVFIAVVPAYWLVSTQLFPVHGLYADYNQVQPSLLTTPWALFEGIRPIARHANDAVAIVFQMPLLFVVVGLIMLRSQSDQTDIPAPHRTPARTLIAAGLAGVLLALLPYAAVGKWPRYQGWETRHALLVGLPMGIALVGFIRLCTHRLAAGRWIAALACAFLATGFCVRKLMTDVAWQARWVHDRAIVEELKVHQEARRASILTVEDGARRGLEEHYGFYEWAFLFEQAWGEQSHIGFDDGQPEVLEDRFLAVRYYTRDVDREGCRGHLTIAPTAPRSDLSVVVEYEMERLLGARVPAVLQRLVDLTYTAGPAGGRHCTAAP
jgi:hypothetical protein